MTILYALLVLLVAVLDLLQLHLYMTFLYSYSLKESVGGLVQRYFNNISSRRHK